MNFNCLHVVFQSWEAECDRNYQWEAFLQFFQEFMKWVVVVWGKHIIGCWYSLKEWKISEGKRNEYMISDKWGNLSLGYLKLIGREHESVQQLLFQWRWVKFAQVWSRKSISLQAYLHGCQDATRAFLRHCNWFSMMEKNHLESLIKEGSKVFEQLEKLEAEMAEKKINLTAMYEKLMNMCLKPDVELLKVGMGHYPGNILYYWKPTPLISIIYLIPKLYISSAPAFMVESGSHLGLI